MKFEIRAYYTRGIGYASKLDEECSVPVRDISNEESKTYMDFYETLGFRRHENDTQIWYEEIRDSNHSVEHIFYK